MKVLKNDIQLIVTESEYRIIVDANALTGKIEASMNDNNTLYGRYTKEDVIFVMDFLQFLDNKVELESIKDPEVES